MLVRVTEKVDKIGGDVIVESISISPLIAGQYISISDEIFYGSEVQSAIMLGLIERGEVADPSALEDSQYRINNLTNYQIVFSINGVEYSLNGKQTLSRGITDSDIANSPDLQKLINSGMIKREEIVVEECVGEDEAEDAGIDGDDDDIDNTDEVKEKEDLIKIITEEEDLDENEEDEDEIYRQLEKMKKEDEPYRDEEHPTKMTTWDPIEEQGLSASESASLAREQVSQKVAEDLSENDLGVQTGEINFDDNVNVKLDLPKKKTGRPKGSKNKKIKPVGTAKKSLRETDFVFDNSGDELDFVNKAELDNQSNPLVDMTTINIVENNGEVE